MQPYEPLVALHRSTAIFSTPNTYINNGIGWFAHIYSEDMEPEYGVLDDAPRPRVKTVPTALPIAAAATITTTTVGIHTYPTCLYLIIPVTLPRYKYHMKYVRPS